MSKKSKKKAPFETVQVRGVKDIAVVVKPTRELFDKIRIRMNKRIVKELSR